MEKVKARHVLRKRLPVILCLCAVILAMILPYLFSIASLILSGVGMPNPDGIFDSMERPKNCFHAYTYDDEYMYYRCTVGLANYSRSQKTVRICGLYLCDYLLGYISSPLVWAVDENGEILNIQIEANEWIQMDNVTFMGARGYKENPLKFNRSMPLLLVLEENGIQQVALIDSIDQT